jgi:phage gp29-like protein
MTALERATAKLVEVTKRIDVAWTNRDKAIKMLTTQEAALKRLMREQARLVKHKNKLAKEALASVTPADTGIPDFLQRDKLVAAEIKAEVDDRKKRKVRGRVAKMLAKKAGETTRMPLEGREAERFLKTL